jgi:hypothetical protein
VSYVHMSQAAKLLETLGRNRNSYLLARDALTERLTNVLYCTEFLVAWPWCDGMRVSLLNESRQKFRIVAVPATSARNTQFT